MSVNITDEQSLLSMYMMTISIEKATKKIKWFGDHLERCKKNCDRVKLSVLIVCELLMVASLTQQVIQDTKAITEDLTKGI